MHLDGGHQWGRYDTTLLMNGASTTNSGIHLLVVEDSPLMRGRIVEHLSELNAVAKIFEAKDVPSALQLLNGTCPHIALVDFYLPGGNGLDVIRAIKLRSVSACVIVFTTHNSEQVRTACLREGADHFFSKSDDFTAVEAVIVEFADQFRKEA